MAYCYPDMPSKAALKRALAKGEKFTVKENTPWGDKRVLNGTIALEGPHYPKPHKWYGSCQVVDGYLTTIE